MNNTPSRLFLLSALLTLLSCSHSGKNERQKELYFYRNTHRKGEDSSSYRTIFMPRLTRAEYTTNWISSGLYTRKAPLLMLILSWRAPMIASTRWLSGVWKTLFLIRSYRWKWKCLLRNQSERSDSISNLCRFIVAPSKILQINNTGYFCIFY